MSDHQLPSGSGPGHDDIGPPLPAYRPPTYEPPATAADPAADPALRASAVKRLKDKADFRIHLTVYVAVIGFLTAIWLVTGAGYFWPIWPAMGWGLGLGLHLASLGWDKPPSEEEIAREARRLKERGYPTTRPEDDR